MASGLQITVKDIDHGWADIRDRVLNLGSYGHVCRVGVQGVKGAAQHKKRKKSPLTVAQIATIQEFGKVIHQPKMKRTIVIPPRSFIGGTVDLYQEAIAKREALFASGVVLGKFDERTALELFGQYVVGLIQQRMADGIPPPNSEYTKAAKGSSTPLIDSGQLRASVTYIVERASP